MATPLCDILDALEALTDKVDELVDCTCPQQGCPSPTIDLFCDTDDTKYIILNQLDTCGESGVFLATPYYADGTLTPYERISVVPQICSDASIKDQECVIDECGNKFTCVTVVTPVEGEVVETKTCTPYIEPECPEAEETEGLVGERVAAKIGERKAIATSFTAVKSIKLSVVAVNTTLTETADETTGEVPAPVGQTWPCKCPVDPVADLLQELLDCLCGDCPEEEGVEG